MYKKLTMISLLVGSLVATGFGSETGELPHGRLAILEIENTTGRHASFVQGLPDMMVTELVRRTDEQLVERNRIQAAMKELKLDGYGFTIDNGQRIGKWLGADKVMLGSLIQLGSLYRLDMRVIEVESGNIRCAAEASVRTEDLLPLVSKVTDGLLTCLASKRIQSIPQSTATSSKPVLEAPSRPSTYTSTPSQRHVRIRNRIVLSLFTEKPVPMQKVRIWVDDRMIGESPIIDAVNKDFAIFDGTIPGTGRMLRLEHGIVSKDGSWKRLLQVQPQEILLPEYLSEFNISYRLEVSSANMKFGNIRWE